MDAWVLHKHGFAIEGLLSTFFVINPLLTCQLLSKAHCLN